MKYIDAEKIRSEVERIKEANCASPISVCNDILSFIDYLKQEQSISSNLDEAAEDFVWEVMENDENGISELSRKLYPWSKISDYYDGLAEFFKAGAEWMIERVISWLKENGHIYLYDAEVNRGDDYKVDLRISEKCFEDLRKAIKEK